jgi:uncharacterized protein involved in response to NO
MRPLPIAGEPPAPRARRGAGYLYGLAGSGFRVFFLVAAAFAIAVVPVWLFVLDGSLPARSSYLMPMGWHAHEMVFGFACAIVAGFVLTAARSWTGRETATGGALYGLAALWMLGRVVVSVDLGLPGPVVALVDLAFLPAVGVAIARPIIAARSTRNFVMIGIVALLSVANLAVHLDALGVLPGWQLRATHAAVGVLALLASIIAGRVVPMFTRNATQSKQIVSVKWLDLAAVVMIAVHVGLELVAPFSRPATTAAAVAAVCLLARSARWGALASLRHPLLWILHVGHVWIGVGLALRVASVMTARISATAGTHALTVGAIGCLTLGMMARVSLGHTGRPLVVRRTTVVAFGLVTLAAALRVVAPIAGALPYPMWLALSAAAWSTAFALFLVGYAGVLVRPRSIQSATRTRRGSTSPAAHFGAAAGAPAAPGPSGPSGPSNRLASIQPIRLELAAAHGVPGFCQKIMPSVSRM